MRRTRALVQMAMVAVMAWIGANAAFLVAQADQFRTPPAWLAWINERGWFLYGEEHGVLSVEDFCPFGPVEGAFRFFESVLYGDGISFVGPVTLRNLAFLLAFILLALITKKTFCSWLCPFGALFEAVGSLGRKLRLPQYRPRERIDRYLRHLRHVVLVLTVVLTAWAGSLLFKEIDPFYALYSIGADVRPVAAYIFTGVLFAVALFIPGVWCHYLCPMGSFLDPFSRLGLIKNSRAGQCVGCQMCSKACPQRLPVAELERVASARCTNCLDCHQACPTPEALELRLEVRP